MTLEYTQEVQDFFELMLRENDVDVLVEHFPSLFSPLTLFQHGVQLQGSEELVSFPCALQNNHCLTPFLDCLDQLFPGQNYRDSLMNYPMSEGSLLEREQAQNQQDIERQLNHLAVAEVERPAVPLFDHRAETPPIDFLQTPPASPRTPARPQTERVCPGAPNSRAIRRAGSVGRLRPYDVAQSRVVGLHPRTTLFNLQKADNERRALADLMAAQRTLIDLFSEDCGAEDGLMFKA